MHIHLRGVKIYAIQGVKRNARSEALWLLLYME